jgi:hypothetical protein
MYCNILFETEYPEWHCFPQVVFTKSPAAMTWRYPQPRTLTRVSVFPVPFKSASESGFDFGDDREVSNTQIRRMCA